MTEKMEQKKSFEKAIRTLEFDKIREMLAAVCPTEGAKKLAMALCPSRAILTVRRMLAHTDAAKSMQTVKGMPPFSGISDITDAVDRADEPRRIAPGKAADAVGDIDDDVTDALEVVVDFEDGDDEPQIARHRLVQGEDFQAFLFDGDFLGVDFVIRGDEVGERLFLRVEELSDDEGEPFLDAAGEFVDPVLEGIGFAVEDDVHAGSRVGRW